MTCQRRLAPPLRPPRKLFFPSDAALSAGPALLHPGEGCNREIRKRRTCMPSNHQFSSSYIFFNDLARQAKVGAHAPLPRSSQPARQPPRAPPHSVTARTSRNVPSARSAGEEAQRTLAGCTTSTSEPARTKAPGSPRSPQTSRRPPSRPRGGAPGPRPGAPSIPPPPASSAGQGDASRPARPRRAPPLPARAPRRVILNATQIPKLFKLKRKLVPPRQ